MDFATLLDEIDTFNVISAAIAVVSVVLNFVIVSRQSAIQMESARIQADSAIFDWGKECVDTISRAIEYSDHPAGEIETSTERQYLRWKLSSLVDQGRMFFPNEATTKQNQMGRNSGWRPAVLDAVAFAQFTIRDEEKLGDRLSERSAFLKECRRLFYSEIQRATGPERRAKMLGRLQGERRGDGMNEFQRALAQRLEEMLPGTLDRFRLVRPE